MLLTLVYFIRVLMRFNEPTAVIAAFTMFTGVLAISIIDTVFPHLLHADYGHWLGTLTEVISLLVAFRSFFIKNAGNKLTLQGFWHRGGPDCAAATLCPVGNYAF